MFSFETMGSRLSKGDTSLLAEIHAMTSGFESPSIKLWCSRYYHIETARRRSMGGQGYNTFAGLASGRLYAMEIGSGRMLTISQAY
jgi:acyl-CoA oxidase